MMIDLRLIKLRKVVSYFPENGPNSANCNGLTVATFAMNLAISRGQFLQRIDQTTKLHILQFIRH